MRKYVCELTNAGSSVQSVQIQVGRLLFLFTFTWPENETDEYNQFMRNLSRMAASDPLVKGSDFIRNYDYVQYYIDFPEEITEDTILPQSLKGHTEEEIMQIVAERKEEVSALKIVLDEYRQLMVWDFSYTLNGVVNTGILRTGGWYKGENYRFRFVSNKEEIGVEDLAYVTIEFEVEE